MPAIAWTPAAIAFINSRNPDNSRDARNSKNARKSREASKRRDSSNSGTITTEASPASKGNQKHRTAATVTTKTCLLAMVRGTNKGRNNY